MAAKKTEEIEFKCPMCGALPHKHGKGGKEACMSSVDCEGLICDCDSRDAPESDEKDHGTSYANPCHEAQCHHCGWGGTVPMKPKGLLPWEKKALDAGWTPPAKRLAELQKKGK